MAVSLTGTVQSEQRYWPWGTARNASGALPTDYRYTWQHEVSVIGLYDYDARWYDPDLKRFVQADTLVPEPGNPQALNRYSYALDNPLRYVDPTGHAVDPGGATGGRRKPRPPPIVPVPVPTPAPEGTPTPGQARLQRTRFVQRPFQHQYQGDATNDCGPFAVAIALNAYQANSQNSGTGMTFQGADVAREMNRLPDRIPNSATFPWGMESYSEEQGVPSSWQPFTTEDELQGYLDQNRVAIVIVGGHNLLAKEGLWGHAMVLQGYDPAHRFDDDTVGSAYAFVNPGEHSPDTWWQQRDYFLRDWGGMWSLVVTLGE